MARKMRKFSAGGAQGRYDRRMADIKKDFAKDSAGKSGRALEVLEAKRAQRIADAEDDRAKRTGADRTATRAAEAAAESNLTKTRKFGAPKAVTTEAPASKVMDSMPALTAPKMDSSIGKPQSFAAAFKDARSRLGAGKTFTFNGKSFTTNIAGEGRKPTSGGSSTNKGATTSPASTNKSAGTPDIDKRAEFRRQTAAKQAELRREANRAAMRRNTAGKTQLVGPADSQEARIRTAQKTMAAVKPVDDKAAKLSRLKVAAEAPGATQFAKDRYKYAVSSGMYAKGGKVKKEKTMKYAKGGSTPPQPSAADRARSKKHLAELKKLKPTAEQAKVIASANRSEGPGYKKGGKMAPKFGAAMVKKSADTKGRAMVKKAGGGKCYASGGLVGGHKSADGIAKKGKTKGKMV